MFRIVVNNFRGDFVASAFFSSREACLWWYNGFIYHLNPNNNEKDFYPYCIVEV